MADEAAGWNALRAKFEMSRIDHSKAYSEDGVYSNGADGYFSRLRLSEVGHHHHISGQYLVRYVQEMSWREDHRRVANGTRSRPWQRWR